MGQRLVDGMPAIRRLEGKRVVVLLGPTGSGKSTLANAMISGADTLLHDEKTHQLSPTVPLEYEGRALFGVGHEATSCTSIPSFHPLDAKETTFLVDCPGFGDSDCFKELPNATLVHQVIKSASTVTICLVVKGASLQSSHGTGYMQVMTTIKRMLSQSGINNGKTVLLPLINQPNAFRASGALQKSLRKPADVLQ